jgi:hypothetical protein
MYQRTQHPILTTLSINSLQRRMMYRYRKSKGLNKIGKFAKVTYTGGRKELFGFSIFRF